MKNIVICLFLTKWSHESLWFSTYVQMTLDEMLEIFGLNNEVVVAARDLATTFAEGDAQLFTQTMLRYLLDRSNLKCVDDHSEPLSLPSQLIL